MEKGLPGEVVHIESGEAVMDTLSMAAEAGKVEDGSVYGGTRIVRHSKGRMTNGTMACPPANTSKAQSWCEQ